MPAIEAKRNSLLARIQSSVGLLRTVNKDGERKEERKEIHRKIELDTRELLGWTQTAEILQGFLVEEDKADHFLTDQPEIVRKHLRRVVQKSSRQEFLLHRILEANSYPSLASDELRLKATRLCRKLLSHSYLDENVVDDDAYFEIRALASAIHTRLKAEGISLAELASEIDNMQKIPSSPIPHKKLGGQ